MFQIKGIKFKYLAIALGVLALVFGIYSTAFSGKGYSKTQATITSVVEEPGVDVDDTEYTVMVEYTVDGRTYNEELGEYSDGYKEGKVIDILYDPADPTGGKPDGYCLRSFRKGS